jgi:hypothetical protein
MRIFPGRLVVIAAVAIASLLATPARAVVLDWQNVTWNPGDLTNSYDASGDGLNDITITASSQQANVWRTDSASGSQTPVVNTTMTGGQGAGVPSLMLAADLHTNSNAQVQITFSQGGVDGATNVSFTIFDIDLTADRDIISNIYGLAPDGVTHIAATITNLGSQVSLTGTGLTQTLTDPNPVANDSSNGNATISFGGALITDVFFTWGNSAGPPKYQDIGISNITFTPVPEINPAATAAVSCVFAVGLTVFARRRAKRKAAALPAALR